MPAYRALVRQPTRALAFWISALIVMFFLVVGSRTLADTLVNLGNAIKVSRVTSILQNDENSSVDRAGAAVVPDLMPRTSLADGTVTWTTGRILKEVGKQAIDQPGHFLVGAGPIWASRYLVGVPWFGWAVAPLLAYREWLQWPSRRWWDPPLDWAFLTLGAVAATWSRRPGRGLAGGFAAIRQSMASGRPLPLMR